jgi:hypothetical protein
MKLYIFFDAFFLEWPVAILQRLAERDSETSFAGVVNTPFRKHVKWIINRAGAPNSGLDFLDDLERQWLSTPCDEAKLSNFEDLLGPGTLKRILTADRQIGIGLVSGADFSPTYLMRYAGDAETVSRYIGNLVDHAFLSLKETKPDLFLCTAVDNAPKTAFSIVCKHLGIPFRAIASGRIGDRQLLDDSEKALLSPVRRTYERAMEDPAVVEEFLPQARKFIADFRSNPRPPNYYSRLNVAQMEEKSAVSVLKRPLVKFSRFSRLLFRKESVLRDWELLPYVVHRFRPALRRWKLMLDGTFRRVGQLPDRPFAYFPLHYEPEASTMLTAPMHTDQLSVIEALVKSLPTHMPLVVKEHIVMLGNRPKSFYRRLRRMPTVILASPQENGLELVKKADLTCVITGTAAWEALLLRKPVLIVGATFFMPIGHGFVHCPDLSGLPTAVLEALKCPPVDDRLLELYVAALFKETFDMPSELIWSHQSEETVRRHPELVELLAQRIENIVDGRSD